MEIKSEKNVNASVKIGEEEFINEGLLSQYINDKEVYLLIKDKNETKELKIHITKNKL